MIGIIADIFYTYDSCIDDDNDELAGYYSTGASGYLVEVEYINDGKDNKLSLLTKIGKDAQGNDIVSMFEDNGIDIEFLRSGTEYTALAIDEDYRMRHSALSDITCDEVVSFIERKNIDKLFISAGLLSFKPVAGEIVSALIQCKDRLKFVAVDASVSWNIMLLETLKESIETLRDSGLDMVIIGEALSLKGVRKMSQTKRNEIFLGLSE